MSSPQGPADVPFSRPGAVDLSSLVNRSSSAPAGSAPGGGGSAGAAGRYVVDVTEATFDAVMQRSMQHVIVVEFHSPRAQGAEQLTQALTGLSERADGRWLLARVNVDAEPRIAQALGIEAVPTVVGVVGGQLAPLFQGVLPADQVQQYLDELMKAAIANRVTGRAEPADGAADDEPTDDDAEESRDPRFAAADEAVDAGDYGRAREEYDKLVQANPNDSEAVAGRAAVGLLARLDGVDGPAAIAAADADPTNLDAQLVAADAELMIGNPAAGFSRLIGQIRTRAGDERNTVRLRLLELFETQPPEDPALLKARRELMAALF